MASIRSFSRPLSSFERAAAQWIPLVLPMFLFVSGCETVTPAHPYSYQFEDERVVVDIKHLATTSKTIKPEDSKRGEGQPEAFVPAAVLAPLAFDYTIKTLAKKLEEESTKYSAEYHGFASDDKFYDNTDPSADIAVEGIEIKRIVRVDNQPATEALTLLLKVVPSSDKTAFRLVPAKVRLGYAKAKVGGTRRYLPWTWFDEEKDKLDLDITVTIEALWVDEDQRTHNEVIAALDIPLRGVTLVGPSNNASTMFLPNTASQWFPAVPRTAINNSKTQYGTGTYVVKVKVREYDNFGKRVKAVSEYIESNRDSWARKFENKIAPPALE